MPLPRGASDLFRHVSADKSALYRAVLDTFASARRHYRLQLRPDEVLADTARLGAAPSAEELTAALAPLVAWGNLEAQPDIARVTTLADYYRARLLYRLSAGGEAVESSLTEFARLMARRAELQSVALEDIVHGLQALAALLDRGSGDVQKLHETLRGLLRASRAWPTTPRPSWPAWRVRWSCSVPKKPPWRPTKSASSTTWNVSSATWCNARNASRN